MRLTRTEVARRESVAMNYFKANPKATGESFNMALKTGVLTGQPEKAMGLKRIYELRTKVRDEVATSFVATQTMVNMDTPAPEVQG